MNIEILKIIIPARKKGARLDSSLSEMLPDFSRSKITSWIKSGDALINKKLFKPKDKDTTVSNVIIVFVFFIFNTPFSLSIYFL